MDKEHRMVVSSEFTSKSIVSYGLIVYAKDTRRWLMIRRRHSVEFLLIIKGNYRISYLATIVEGLTKEEVFHLYKCISDINYFKDLYYKVQGYTDLYYLSKIIFLKNKEFMKNLLDIPRSNNKLKWTWPKGRLNSVLDGKESPFTCAVREFTEEVERNLPIASYISIISFQEIYKTYISGWNLENRYWLYIVDKEFEISQPSENIEVSKRKWCSLNQCKKYLPKNNIFVKDVVSYMNDLENY